MLKLLSNAVTVLMLICILTIEGTLNAYAAPNWSNLGKACLPEEGRMSKDLDQACHCPPQSYCPSSTSEWSSHPHQPGFISAICCERPRTCEINLNSELSCGEEDYFEKTEHKFCIEYEFNDDRAQNEEHGDRMKSFALTANTCLRRMNKNLDDVIDDNSHHDYAWARWYQDFYACSNYIRQSNQTGKKFETDNFVCTKEREVRFCTTYFSPPCETNNDCVTGDSKIALSDGRTKPISQVQAGDVVKGLTSSNVVLAISRVEQGDETLSRINGAGGFSISVGHPVLTTDGWKALSPERVEHAVKPMAGEITKLKVGDTLIGHDGLRIAVKTITKPDLGSVTLYNLSVNGDRTFTVNGVVVRGYNNEITY